MEASGKWRVHCLTFQHYRKLEDKWGYEVVHNRTLINRTAYDPGWEEVRQVDQLWKELGPYLKTQIGFIGNINKLVAEVTQSPSSEELSQWSWHPVIEGDLACVYWHDSDNAVHAWWSTDRRNGYFDENTRPHNLWWDTMSMDERRKLYIHGFRVPSRVRNYLQSMLGLPGEVFEEKDSY
jgi:hypothetical protein